MITLRNLDQLLKENLKDKIVFVRVDLNIPIKDNLILDDTRIERIIPTIKELKKHGCKICLLSHFGRPDGKNNENFSLKQVIPSLEKHLREKIIFSESLYGDNVKTILNNAPSKSIILFENTRFEDGEEKNDKELAKKISMNGNYFVNDAFSVSHRSHMSTTGLSNYLPSYSGRYLEQEILMINEALSVSEGKRLGIIGGSKISTKLKVLENLTEKLDILFVGGGMANTFLLAQGFKIGKSLCEKSMLDIALNILEAAKNKNCKIILPEDALIAKNMEKGTPFDEVTIDKVPDDGLILDIGSKTIRSMNEYLNNVNSVVWCGPLGLFEVNPFQTGTVAIAKEISNLTKKNKLVSIAGGGDTVAALSQSNYDKGFTYISTAGGAFLELLAGEELPGIEVLKT
ncbi:phosphoglycerate kinase [Hyphomicrobiales bacterium]|nr:phosphoglycerate kinase [Hyphomicrobiales bacterium]